MSLTLLTWAVRQSSLDRDGVRAVLQAGKWCFTSSCRAESERTTQLGGAWLKHTGMSLVLFLTKHLVRALALIGIPKDKISC